MNTELIHWISITECSEFEMQCAPRMLKGCEILKSFSGGLRAKSPTCSAGCRDIELQSVLNSFQDLPLEVDDNFGADTC